VPGSAVPIAGAAEEQPRKRARYNVQPGHHRLCSGHHGYRPSRFPPAQPVRVRVYPARYPASYSPVPLAPPTRIRVPPRMLPYHSPVNIAFILEDIRHDQRELRLTCNNIATEVNTLWHKLQESVKTMTKLSTQLVELYQTLNQ
jgi:hypothetical protein